MEDRQRVIEELTQEFKKCCEELLNREVPNQMALDAIEGRTEEVLRRIGSSLIEKQIEQLGTGRRENKCQTPGGEEGIFKGVKKNNNDARRRSLFKQCPILCEPKRAELVSVGGAPWDSG